MTHEYNSSNVTFGCSCKRVHQFSKTELTKGFAGTTYIVKATCKFGRTTYLRFNTESDFKSGLPSTNSSLENCFTADDEVSSVA